ncbi:MAG TPA: TonB-dependent receptor, partial [Flavitalea sp.]|nr:TonB-dependent receptor [Flavitalea sp.]
MLYPIDGRRILLAFILSVTLQQAYCQEQVRIQVHDAGTAHGLAAVTISANRKAVGMTDSSGLFQLSLPAGKYQLMFSSKGYLNENYTVVLPDTSLIIIGMKREEQELNSVTVVASTRNNQPIESSPLKVEILGREEMEEENTIKPGNIASILGDISGVQIQQSSATSGNSNVRIQGLEGKYTQIVRDGLPLFEGFSGGFGVLSVPPLDLRQVELIKGSASTLYGGGAIGGLINLISRKPSREQEGTLTLNGSTLKEFNANAYGSKKNDHIGYTMFAGYTKQSASDINSDGFSDVPDLESIIIHPKLFIYPSSSGTIAIGYSAVFEKRSGGDMQVLQKNADNLHQYFENNKTRRQTTELVYDQYLRHHKKLQVKASLSEFNRDIVTNIHHFDGQQTNYFTEASLLIPFSEHSFVAGINVSGDDFKIRSTDPVRLVPFTNNVAGAFAQLTTVLKDATTLETGIRYDYHNTYGGFFLPRIAVFHRFNEHWGTRAGIGFGYKTPDPLSQQVIELP